MKKPFYPLLFWLALVFVSVTQVKAQTTVLFESFENPAAFATNWVVESNFPDEEDPVLWGTVNNTFGFNEQARTGTNKAYCAAVGWQGSHNHPYYPDNVSTIMSRDFDLQGYKSATLTFWFKARIFPGNEEEFDEFFSDYMTVYVNDEPHYSSDTIEGVVGTWTKVVVNLDQYVGTVCNLKFEFESDIYGQDDGVARGEGVYLEDVLITGYTDYRADYNKDGEIDLLFHNLNDGRLAIWYMSNYTQMAQSVLVRDGISVPSVWRVGGQSDFDRNGSADILWHHVDGRLSVWFMDGGTFLQSSLIRTVGPGWRLMAMADFNNDGNQDFVWQHQDRRVAVWYMDGTNFLTSSLVSKNLPDDINVVGSGDFNFDGRRDLLIQKKSSGKIWSRQLLGTTYVKDVAFTYETSSFSADWRVAGTHDMNGDGEPDLLMRNINGLLEAWILNGTHVMERISIRNAGVQWTNAGHR